MMMLRMVSAEPSFSLISDYLDPDFSRLIFKNRSFQSDYLNVIFFIYYIIGKQELRILSRSLSDLNFMNHDLSFSIFLCLCYPFSQAMFPHPSDQLSERTHVSTTALQCSEDAKNVSLSELQSY